MRVAAAAQSLLCLAGASSQLSYEADFSTPLNLVQEPQLLDSDGKRVAGPGEAEWILESEDDKGTAEISSCKPLGSDLADTEAKCLKITCNDAHSVLWLNRRFGPNSRLSFGLAPKDSSKGLGIIFFSTAPLDADTKSIFSLSLPARNGVYKNYNKGELENYGVSYWRANIEGGVDGCEHNPDGECTANLKKNPGANLEVQGRDLIIGNTPKNNGFFDVVIERSGGYLTVSVDGEVSTQWQDPKPLSRDETYFGFRHMASTEKAWYSYVRVEEIGGSQSASVAV